MASYVESTAIGAKARALGVSNEELIELAVQNLEIPSETEAAELRMLVDQVNKSIPETLRIVDRCHRHVLQALGEAGKYELSQPAASEA